MTDAPRIFGVEMRRSKSHWQLKGCRINEPDLRGEILWSVALDGFWKQEGLVLSNEMAALCIESAITEIRDRAANLGI